jgi:hypothetical protein
MSSVCELEKEAHASIGDFVFISSGARPQGARRWGVSKFPQACACFNYRMSMRSRRIRAQVSSSGNRIIVLARLRCHCAELPSSRPSADQQLGASTRSSRQNVESEILHLLQRRKSRRAVPTCRSFGICSGVRVSTSGKGYSRPRTIF